MTNIRTLFNIKDNDFIDETQFFDLLKKQGIRLNDPRLMNVLRLFENTVSAKENIKKVEADLLQKAASENNFLEKTLLGETVIPDFENFTSEIEKIFAITEGLTNGEVASYIPQLARVDPDLFTIAICTVDGQVCQLGNADASFCLQSTSKPVTYAIVLEKLGEEKVHRHIGKEPSGRSFNELSLNHLGLPHNPLINAGAIMTSSLINPDCDISDRFDYIMKKWAELAGDSKLNFNNAVYLSERSTADRNFALAYFMRENKAFDTNVNIHEALDLYFQCCSIEVNAFQLATVAATFANSGINPFSSKRIFSASTIQNCLSMMNSCGMYDYSGEWAFQVGVPAKSGVSGAIWLVIPNVMGICVYSPRLDRIGNSVRGVAFAKELVRRFNFHNYDSVNHENGNKKDPRRKRYQTKASEVMSMIFAAANGDLGEVKRIHATGININESDYDGRTALHLAVAENKADIVRYLLNNGGDPNAKDRWGGTPLSDAKKAKHQDVFELLSKQYSLQLNGNML